MFRPERCSLKDDFFEKLNMMITVHSRYLGSKKLLGRFYHYINIGSCFFMFLDK